MQTLKRVFLFMLSVILVLNSIIPIMNLSASSECYASFSLDTNYLLLGKTYIADFIKYPSDLEVTLTSSNTNVLTVTQTGVVTPRALGAATIFISYYDDYDDVEVEDYFSVVVVDSTGLESGETYYIMNANTGRLLASDSTDSGYYTNVITLSSVWAARSQWEIEELSDGRYNIYGFGGSSGIILKTFGTSVELETKENIDAEKFNIYRINTGVYAGLYYIRLGNYYVCQDANNDVYLSTNMTMSSRWSFMNVEKRTASMYAFNYTIVENGVSDSFSTITHLSTFRTTLRNLGYTVNTKINTTAATAYDDMRAGDDVFVFNGHGAPGLISFYSYNGTNIGIIAATPITPNGNAFSRYMSSNNNNQLAKVRCVLYMGCETGVDDSWGFNLVDETFYGGAHFVLGTTRILYTTTVDTWLDLFLEKLNTGTSIEVAINYANSEINEIKVGFYKDNDVGELTGVEYLSYMPLYKIGDAKQYLNMD